MTNSTGSVAQIQGAVVDCEFPAELLPEIYEAVIKIKSVARDPGSRAKISVFWQAAQNTQQITWSHRGSYGFGAHFGRSVICRAKICVFLARENDA